MRIRVKSELISTLQKSNEVYTNGFDVLYEHRHDGWTIFNHPALELNKVFYCCRAEILNHSQVADVVYSTESVYVCVSSCDDPKTAINKANETVLYRLKKRVESTVEMMVEKSLTETNMN